MKIRVICNDNWANKEFVLNKVKKNGCALEYASEELRNDKEIVLEAVKQNGKALKYANEELRGDKEVVIEAVKQNSNALQYASKKLFSSKKFMIEAVKQDGHILRYASKKLRNDKKVVLEAVGVAVVRVMAIHHNHFMPPLAVAELIFLVREPAVLLAEIQLVTSQLAVLVEAVVVK